MEKAAKISPFRLASLLRLEKNPAVALELFRNPNGPSTSAPPKPFRRSARVYDLIVCKLGRAKMFAEMERVLEEMRLETRFAPKEVLFCHVISFYARARMPSPAIQIYDRIPSFRCPRTVRSFNSLLHALLVCGDSEGVRALCCELEAGAIAPDACTYNVLIRACASSGSVAGAWDLFDEMRKRGIRPTATTYGSLIAALCANSNLDSAFRLKDEMMTVYSLKPNVFVYTSLIKALFKRNELKLAFMLKEEMLLDRELVLDSAFYSTLIRALFRAGLKGEVVAVLEEMKAKRIDPDTVTYNAMISGFCDEKEFDAAFEVLNEMARKGCKADVVSYNTIIAGLCMAGMWQDASDVFEDMPKRNCLPDVVSHRTLFEGLCNAGELSEAALLLDEMVFKGYMPGMGNVRKFVKRLCEAGDLHLVCSALCTLAKVNTLELDVWMIAVQGLVKETEMLMAGELVDQVTVGCE